MDWSHGEDCYATYTKVVRRNNPVHAANVAKRRMRYTDAHSYTSLYRNQLRDI
jgi:hypothetical protein